MMIRVRWKGHTTLINRLQRMPKKLEDELGAYLELRAMDMYDYAFAFAPHMTGALKASAQVGPLQTGKLLSIEVGFGQPGIWNPETNAPTSAYAELRHRQSSSPLFLEKAFNTVYPVFLKNAATALSRAIKV